MKSYTLILLFAIFTYTTVQSELRAQTCRVSTGKVSNGTQVIKEVYEFDFVDIKPEFAGGEQHWLNYINENRKYPEEAYAKGIEGRVTCSFVVNTDGSISNVSIIKGVECSLNREAVRLLTSMPTWKPGKIGSQCVPVRVIRCIPFRK